MSLWWTTSALAADPLDGPYAFCQDVGAATEDAKAWCDLLDGLPEDRCPGLREACKADTWSAEPLSCAGAGIPGFDTVPAGAPDEPLLPNSSCQPTEEPSTCVDSVGVEPSPAARWAIALIVAFVVVGFGLALLRGVRTALKPLKVPAPAPPPVEEEEVPDRPAPDLLAEAEAALQRGDLAAAIASARFAALRALAEGGHIVLHRARTDRETLRAVTATFGPDLRTLLRHFEASRWAKQPIVLESAREAVDAARRLVAP